MPGINSFMGTKQQKSQLVYALIIVGLIIATRTFLKVAPNFEWVTALTIFSALKLNKPFNFLAPMVGIILSDIIIGNSAIFIFTWSGFAVSFLLGLVIKKHLNKNIWRDGALFVGTGILGVFFFYFWTNFGVVLEGHLYALSLSGYAQSLIAGLPFLRLQLQSVVFTSVVIVSLVELAKSAYDYTKVSVIHQQ